MPLMVPWLRACSCALFEQPTAPSGAFLLEGVMPRWPDGHISKRTCPKCGGKKDFYALTCRACCLTSKPLLGKSGSDHPAWKGGSRIDRDGYIRTYKPSHPWPRRGGYVLEHVRIMELHIGRRIRPDEVVHHKDDDRQHNELSNLRLMTKGAHSRLHRLKDTHLRKRGPSGRFA